MVIRTVHRLSRILLTCPAQVHFRLLTCSITSVTFVFSFTHMFVFLYRYVMFNILLSIFVCAATSLFFAWMVSAHVSAPYVIAGSTHELQFLSLQACSNVTLEDVAVLGECYDSSFNLLGLVFVSGAVSLSQVDVSFNVLDLKVVDICWFVVFHNHLCLRLVHFQTLVLLSSANSCSICCSSCGVLAHMNMLSASAEYSFECCDMVSPLLVLILLYLYRWTDIALFV